MTTTSIPSIPKANRKKKKRKAHQSHSHLLHKGHSQSYKTTTTSSTTQASLPVTATHNARALGTKVLPSKLGRQLIRSHHTLQKQLSQALSAKIPDESHIASLQLQIADLGGLEKYQQASISGQNTKRGGDSSGVLVKWLTEEGVSRHVNNAQGQSIGYKLLEIGSLSPDNEVATCGIFKECNITRIDLNSVHPRIQKCDFMQFEVPEKDEDKFDVISCSLVLNYVPDPVGRGDMLKRTLRLLRTQRDTASKVIPCLFLVLPAPCVTNSRYLTKDRLINIMEYLGYSMIKHKITEKLVYNLWKLNSTADIPSVVKDRKMTFKKEEVNPGGGRNNFAVVLK